MSRKNKDTINRDIELIFEIGCLRFMQRSWKRFLDPHVANNAEHTFRVIWIAWLLAKRENIKDIEKVIKMAIVHDVSESRTGDVDYLSRQYVERNELKAIEDVTASTIMEKEVRDLWQEYEKRESIESKIVKDADNLDVDFELMEQEAQGHGLRHVLGGARRKFVYPKLYTKSAKATWKVLNKAGVNDWHYYGNNRFRGGDWKK